MKGFKDTWSIVPFMGVTRDLAPTNAKWFVMCRVGFSPGSSLTEFLVLKFCMYCSLHTGSNSKGFMLDFTLNKYVIMHIVVDTHRSQTQRVFELVFKSEWCYSFIFCRALGKDGLVGKTPLFLLSSREGGWFLGSFFEVGCWDSLLWFRVAPIVRLGRLDALRVVGALPLWGLGVWWSHPLGKEPP